jgi:hypothetical protein
MTAQPDQANPDPSTDCYVDRLKPLAPAAQGTHQAGQHNPEVDIPSPGPSWRPAASDADYTLNWDEPATAAYTNNLTGSIVAAIKGARLTALDAVIPVTLVGIGNGTAVPAATVHFSPRIDPVYAGAAFGMLTAAQQFASAAVIASIGTIIFAVLGAGTSRADYASAAIASTACGPGLILIDMIVAARLVVTDRSHHRVQ